VDPLITPDPERGQVVITRFECENAFGLVRLLLLHKRVKRQVRRHATGFVGVRTLVSWRRHTMLSVSVWEDLDSIYSMGQVARHVQAAKQVSRQKVTTASGIFCYAGDWRKVMFRAGEPKDSPLRPIKQRQ
jgi:hypothetical protein